MFSHDFFFLNQSAHFNKSSASSNPMRICAPYSVGLFRYCFAM